MYSMLREAVPLVDSGYATVADVDRSMARPRLLDHLLLALFVSWNLMECRAYKTVMKAFSQTSTAPGKSRA